MDAPTGNPISAVPNASQPIVNAQGAPSTWMAQWMRSVKRVLSPGINATVALAPTTSGGAAGSLTVVNGVITAYTAPT